MSMNNSLSIVLPAYNEGGKIEQTVVEVDSFVERLLPDFEIIVVDDGSTDQTGSVLKDLGRRTSRLHVITHARNLGYGGALRSGADKAQKRLILFMDADGQINIKELPAFLERITSVAAVIGVRRNRQDGSYRRALGRVGNMYLNLLLKERFEDVNCGFKLFRADDLKSMRLYSTGGLISCEILRKLLACGKQICQMPVAHYPRETGKSTGGRPHTVIRFMLETPGLFKN